MQKPGISAFLGIVCLCLSALSGCTGADILNAIIPHAGYQVKKDIPYGKEARQKLDIYIPQSSMQQAAVILFFYGGSWQKGSKDDYRFIGQAFASRGYITVIADYRLYPEVTFPAFLEDSAYALAWTHQHISEYAGNPQNIVVMGHSAGAYNAVMLALDTPYTHKIAPASLIKMAVGIAGPYDFLPFTDPYIKAIFHTQPDRKTQPITWVKPHLPPIFLASGETDKEVSESNTLHMAAALKAQEDEVETKLYPDVGHIGIILSLTSFFHEKDPLMDDIDQFIINHSSAGHGLK